MAINAKQFAFSKAAAELILHCVEQGYSVTLGEALRTPEMAHWYAQRGLGIDDSLHLLRLAIDLLLFKDGKYLVDSESYRPVGEWWEKQPGEFKRVWGGRFGDGNHFSFEHNGVR